MGALHRRGGREQHQCGRATPALEHLEQLVREEQGVMGKKPPPAADTMTWAAWGRPRSQGSSPMGELWGPTVSLCWGGHSHACCP